MAIFDQRPEQTVRKARFYSIDEEDSRLIPFKLTEETCKRIEQHIEN